MSDDITLDLDDGISPARMGAAGFIPLISDAGSTYEADSAIDDHQFAVRTVVDTGDPVPAWTVIPGNHSASAGEIAKVAIIYAETSEGVADDFDLDPGAGPLGKSFYVTPTNLAAVEDISFEMYAILRRADSCQFSLVEKIPIPKNLKTGVPVGFGIGKGFQYAKELFRVVPQGVGRTDVVPEIGRGETTDDQQGYR